MRAQSSDANKRQQYDLNLIYTCSAASLMQRQKERAQTTGLTAERVRYRIQIARFGEYMKYQVSSNELSFWISALSNRTAIAVLSVEHGQQSMHNLAERIAARY